MTLSQQQQQQQQGVGEAPTEREIFKVSGPHYLTAVDWENPSHRRSVVASLVQGVNVLERDRQSGRAGTATAEAEPWWTFFHFQLLHVMADHHHQQQQHGQEPGIFGAVYGYAGPKEARGGPPQTVIAFRGTIRRAGTLSEDIKTNIAIVTGSGFHASLRFRVAMEALHRYYYASAGSAVAVAVAGHSMGAAIAMQAARKLLEERGLTVPVEAHLFNPPFVAAPLGRIRNASVRHGMQVAGGVVAAGLARALKGRQKREQSQRRFFAAAEWVPWIYVNPRDDVCAGYIGHFEKHRQLMRFGGGTVAALAAQHSVGGLLLSSVLGADAGSMHLIPSATLVVAVGPRPAPDFKRAHGIHQWWAPELVVDVQHCRIRQPLRS